MPRKVEARLHPDMYFVGLRMPIPIVNAIDQIAVRSMRTRSDLVRVLVAEALRHRGIVAAEPDDKQVAA